MSLSKESIGSKDPTDHQPLEKNTAVVSVISSKDIAFCHIIKNSVCSRTGLIVRVDTNVVKETHRDEIAALHEFSNSVRIICKCCLSTDVYGILGMKPK